MNAHPLLKILALVLLAFAATGCVMRPNSGVLKPLELPTQNQTVEILVATNRSAAANGGFTTERAGMSFERFVISTPGIARPGEVAYPSRRPDPMREFLVVEREALDRNRFLSLVGSNRSTQEPVGLFVHGYNQSYQEALFRLAQVGTDSNMKAPMVLFAWPSAADLFGYVADRNAVLSSRNDLTELISDLAITRPDQDLVVFGHSMGAFALMESARELRLAGKEGVLDRLSIALAAPDIDVDVFNEQLTAIGRLRNSITVLISRQDHALKASSVECHRDLTR